MAGHAAIGLEKRIAALLVGAEVIIMVGWDKNV
jgi:hypothetical protein